jgi:hypothetical protein
LDLQGSSGREPPLPPKSPPSNNSSPFPPPLSSREGDKGIPTRKSGGGGGRGSGYGYHCPKCGSNLTYRGNDFNENEFYCATCSAWFNIDHLSKIENRPFEDPTILMQHVSLPTKFVVLQYVLYIMFLLVATVPRSI